MFKQLPILALLIIAYTPIAAYAEDPQQPLQHEQAKQETPAKPAIKLGTKRYPDDKLITIDTGNTTGVYYTAGDAICRMINQRHHQLHLRCNSRATLGSVSNIDTLKNGEAQLAIVQSDIQDAALHGKDLYYAAGAFEPMRFLFSLHDEAFTVIARRDQNIKRIDDLGGKVFNIGPMGSGLRAAAVTIMQMKGWHLNYFQSTTELRADEQAKALCQGKIDAMVLVTGHPSKMIEEVAKLCEIQVIPLDDDQVKQFINNNKGYELTQIPAGLYHGAPAETNTVGVRSTVLATTDLSDELAYKITKTIFENLAQLRKVSPVLKHLDKEKMAQDGQIATFHPGAERYFREAGLLKEPEAHPNSQPKQNSEK